MSGVGKRVYLRDVNPYLICPLCRGYLIDATTVVECLHSFCRSCIIKHLNKESRCPSCKLDLNKAKPDIKSDQVLQDIVYKLVPGLYYKEMRRRKEFYKKHPEHAESTTSEQRGEDVRGRLIFTPEDAVSLSLEYLPPGADPIKILSETNDTASNKSPLNNSNNNEQIGSSNRRYLQCPALVTIAHLKKFLAMKYSIDMTRYTIEIYHSRAALPEHFTLMDVALIYAWRRNAPIRFFYRVAHEEQRLEAPPHDRPSTPGLGASLPPIENNQINDENDNDKEENEKNDNITNQLIETKETNDKNSRIRKIIKRVISSLPATSTIPITTLSTPEVVTSTAAETTSADSNTTAVVNSSEEAKQIKTPIKILKNPDGKYEVIKSPPPSWNGVEPVANGSPQSKTPSSLEFSVVSIGDGQNSNGVKITLKQCSPGNNNNNNNNSNSSNNNNNNNNNNSKKPKMTSNILLRQSDKELPNAFMIQHLTADKDKQTQDKQEKQKRRVTFMEKPLITTSDSPKINLKKPTEQTDKKQFLQSFQLTAKESIEHVIPDSSSKLNSNSANSSVEVTRSTPERIMHKTLSSQKTSPCKIDEITKKISDNNTNPNKISEGNINSPVTNNLSNNFRGNIKNQIFGMTNNLVTNISAISSNHSSKLDVYAFPNDPPIVPAGAVKRKSPPGLPTHEAKRKKPMPNQGNKKQINTVQSPNKSPRKSVTDKILHIKKPINILPDPGPSRQCMPSSKSTGNPILLTDTRNLLDGCGLNIPASLSITLTAPKSPGNNTLSSESADSKDTRKNILGKVNPSITLNDRSVDPCVLKALKTGKMKMPSPPKPKQTKQVERGVNAPRQTQGNKRKRDQNSRDILDLSGSKKMDIHPLRIPQPVAKLKPKTVRETIPAMPDQNQVVTFMGHKYYRAPPGSLTPAACRMSDAQIPTPTRTPVYAPAGLSTSLGSNTSRAGNLSSVFPSLQSLYALSQAPNLQQFQMDAKLRLPRSSGDATSSTSNTVNVTTYNCSTPNKTHLAAQCAPVKPARSSLVSLAVPISKQSLVFPTISRPNVTTDSSKSLTSNTQASDNDVNQRLTLQSTNSTESKHSSSADDTNLDDNVERQKAKSEKNDSDLSETKQSETASPRVSSTASPSPPPNDTSSTGNTSDNNEANNATNNISGNSDTSASPLVSNSEKSSTVEIINTKSPASPDSSSVTVENSTKTSMDQGIVSPDKTSDLKLDSPEKTTNLPDDSITDSEKTKINSSPKPQESIQLTSEILQKRFLAAFPSNEWANNPIAAEHLGKFLKSLNASIKSEDKTESCNTEKSENKPINIDKKLVDDDVSVKTKKENEKKA